MGLTTLKDLVGSGVNISLRNAVNRRFINGPRIYTCQKGIATTGGHTDPTNGLRKDLMKAPGPKESVINSVADAKRAVRHFAEVRSGHYFVLCAFILLTIILIWFERRGLD